MTVKEWFIEGRRLKKEIAERSSVRNFPYFRSETIAQKEEELQRKQNMMINVIDKISDANCRRVLIARYIDCISWEEIAINMNYEVRQVYRIHQRALLEAQKHLDA